MAADLAWPRPGTKAEALLEVPGGADGGPLALPLLLARGTGDGPRVAVLGGVHGDEYEGIVGAAAAWADLDPHELRGTLVVAPACNPPAFEAGTRSSPLDGRNLARVFPGRERGTATERLAHALTEAVIRPADLLIDLHSAGQHYAMPLLCGSYAAGDALGARCRAAALAFGAPVYWAHPTVPPGRSLSVALASGIPCLYAECGGGGRVRQADLVAYRDGVRRVLAHAGLLPAAASEPPPPPRLWLRSTGDTDQAIPVARAGILVGRVAMLERVGAGQPLGEVRDPSGRVLELIRATEGGRVVMARRTARVRPGDGAYLIAAEDAAGRGAAAP
jgi:predicted deacylase